MGYTVQIAGAVLILVGFVLAQIGVLSNQSRTYLALNLAGAVVLTADAWVGRQWGFVLLEGVWAIVSAWGLLTWRRPPASAP